MEYKLNCRWNFNHFLGFESRKLNNYSTSSLASHLGLEMFERAWLLSRLLRAGSHSSCYPGGYSLIDSWCVTAQGKWLHFPLCRCYQKRSACQVTPAHPAGWELSGLPAVPGLGFATRSKSCGCGSEIIC